jgi:hypothetical protein
VSAPEVSIPDTPARRLDHGRIALTRESLLPIAGVARFFGAATVHRSGPVRDRVSRIILEAEHQRDPERFAVLIEVERAEDLRGQPLE